MRLFISLLIVIPFLIVAQSPEEILNQSIAYHDPNNLWPQLNATFIFTETRPSGDDRKVTFEVDNGTGSWKLNRNNEEIYEVEYQNVRIVSGDQDEARGLLLRNYYLYLWGLPMKLRDESTPEITRLDDEIVEGVEVYMLRVVYERETYYFSFDQNSGRMLQYRFYKDEGSGKGELIKLKEEVTFNGLKIPKRRSWYTLPEMKYLGTDILDRIE